MANNIDLPEDQDIVNFVRGLSSHDLMTLITIFNIPNIYPTSNWTLELIKTLTRVHYNKTL